MAFEVFDDVAFFFLVTSLLSIALLPTTALWLWNLLKELRASSRKTALPSKSLVKVSDYQGLKDSKQLEDKHSITERVFTVKFAVFALLWVVFLYLLVQLPKFQVSDLASFKPFEILGLDANDAPDEDQIKRAYRKMSLKWHPDKNRDNREEAEKNFILVSKAYQTLTDPAAKENVAKYGSTDGYQGTSVTIGLPSYLTRKENELHILLIYFLIFIVLPPVCVFLWWRRARNFHETGTLHETFVIYFKFITENMTPRQLIEVLAASAEYRVLETRETNSQDMRKLLLLVKEHMTKQKFNRPYIIKASVLLHAHLLRLPIPESLHEDLKIVLKDAHRLLQTMLDVSLSRKHTKAAQNCVKLMQMITQAMWMQDSPLMQLPHITGRDIKAAAKKKITTIQQLKQADQETRSKVFPDIDAAAWKAVDAVAAQLPDVKLDAKCEVEDEEGIYENDIVLITITMTRVGQGLGSAQVEDEQDEDGATKEKKEKKSDDKDDDEDKKDEKEDEGDSSAEKTDEEKELEERNRKELQLLESLPSVAKKKKETALMGREVCSVFFPFPKREKWFVILMEKNKKSGITHAIAMEKVHVFADKPAEVQIRVRAGPKGVQEYEAHAMCDSYVGTDVQVQFKFTVAKMSKKVEDERAAEYKAGKENGLDLLYDVDVNEERDEKEYDQKWYYLYFESFWEMVLNVVVLAGLAFMGYQFLLSRGWWQKYFEPVVNRALKLVEPLTSKIWAVIGPVAEPAWHPVSVLLGYIWSGLQSIVKEDPDAVADYLARKKRGEL